MSKADTHLLSRAAKELIMAELEDALARHEEISFAYVHGSFVQEDQFRDIDIAVYLHGEGPASSLRYELSLESELMALVRDYSVDVRVLNTAPLSFRYHVIKGGTLLIVQNDEERTDFQEATLIQYFDFAPYRALYLRETLGLGV